MKLYKFRALANCKDLKKIKDIIESGFYCSNFLNFNDMNEGVFSINQKNINITLNEKEKYKICSFSGEKALNSKLMWGHYANAGMGVVIEIEVNNQYINDIKKVVYCDNYDKLDSIEKILTHKSKEWSYEHEFRYLSSNHLGDKVKIGEIKKIYFGTPYKKLANYEDIKLKHTKLAYYLLLKNELKDELKKIPKIKTCCYKFSP